MNDTIKVNYDSGKPLVKERHMTENKRAFVEGLGELLEKYSREDISKLTYDKDEDGFEAVTIHYTNGYTKTKNVTGDSVIAILTDVYKALI